MRSEKAGAVLAWLVLGSLEHVLHVLSVDEGVVDGNNVDHRVLQRRAQYQPPDASETVDANRHGSHRLVDINSTG